MKLKAFDFALGAGAFLIAAGIAWNCGVGTGLIAAGAELVLGACVYAYAAAIVKAGG